MIDLRFEEFIKDKLEHYSFASKLMEFCLQRSTKPSWEEFIKNPNFIFVTKRAIQKMASNLSGLLSKMLD